MYTSRFLPSLKFECWKSDRWGGQCTFKDVLPVQVGFQWSFENCHKKVVSLKDASICIKLCYFCTSKSGSWQVQHQLVHSRNEKCYVSQHRCWASHGKGDWWQVGNNCNSTCHHIPSCTLFCVISAGHRSELRVAILLTDIIIFVPTKGRFTP